MMTLVGKNHKLVWWKWFYVLVGCSWGSSSLFMKKKTFVVVNGQAIVGTEIDISWEIPSPPTPTGLPSINVTDGDTLIFAWDDATGTVDHNIFLHPSLDCDDTTNSIEIGTTSGTLYTISEIETPVGTILFFACQIGNHCKAGLHIQVTVVESTTTTTTGGEGDGDNGFLPPPIVPFPPPETNETITNPSNMTDTNDHTNNNVTIPIEFLCDGAVSISMNEIITGTFPVPSSLPEEAEFSLNDDFFTTTTTTNDDGGVGGVGAPPQNIFTKHESNYDPLCGIYSFATGNSGSGRWYTFTGIQDGMVVRATTCSSGTTVPTSILVFHGGTSTTTTTTCQNLQEGMEGTECIAGDYGTYSCDITPYGATTTWSTTVNAIYYIWITAHDDEFATTGGSFEVQLSQVNDVPSNDHPCTTSSSSSNSSASNGTTTYVGISSSPGEIVATGSTINATRDFPYGTTCGPSLDHPGAWHQIQGTGKILTVSACTNITDYHAAVSIYSMDGGGTDDETCTKENLQCVTGSLFSSNPCEFGVAGTVSWFAVNGTTYHIYIHGGGFYISSVGNYGLTVTESDVVVENDFCAQSIDLMIGGATTAEADPSSTTTTTTTVTGSTTNATLEVEESDGFPWCGFAIDAPGVWYKMQGTGAAMQASTCSANTNFNAGISIFSSSSGSCYNRECVTGKSFSSTCASTTSGGGGGGGGGTSSVRSGQQDNFLLPATTRNHVPGRHHGKRRRRRRRRRTRTRTRNLQSSSNTTATVVGDPNAVYWRTLPDETYYILIHGDEESSTSVDDGESSTSTLTGNFELMLNTISETDFLCQLIMQSLLDDVEDDPITCECAISDDGVLTFECSSPYCEYCNDDVEEDEDNDENINSTSTSTNTTVPAVQVCLIEESFGVRLNTTGDLDYLSEWSQFRYVKGRNETVRVDENTETCTVTVDGTQTCNSCELVTCFDGSEGYSIDCLNIDSNINITFADCDADEEGNDSEIPSILVGTILEGYLGDGFEVCNLLPTPAPMATGTGTGTGPVGPPTVEPLLQLGDTQTPSASPSMGPPTEASAPAPASAAAVTKFRGMNVVPMVLLLGACLATSNAMSHVFY